MHAIHRFRISSLPYCISLYREVYSLIVVCDPAKMLAPADNGTQDKKDGHDTKLIRFVEIMQNTKPEKISNEQERENLECFPTFIREYGLSLIHISEPTRLGMISYAVF